MLLRKSPTVSEVGKSLQRRERFGCPDSVLVKLQKDSPYIKKIIRDMTKYTNYFWHSFMVLTGDCYLIDELSDLLSEDHHSDLIARAPGAFLHDIGKLAIVEESVDKSLKVFDFVPEGYIKGTSQQSMRSLEIEVAQHDHPLFSYEMIKRLLENENIPESLMLNIAEIGRNHHLTDGTFKSSYPDEERILVGKDPVQVAAEFIVQLIDVAVSMFEDNRSYRYGLNVNTIFDEISLYLNDKEKLAYIMPLFHVGSVDKLKIEIYLRLYTAFEKIAPYINIIQKKQAISDLLDNDVIVMDSTRSIDLQYLCDKVWEEKGKQLMEKREAAAAMNNNFFHLSRNEPPINVTGTIFDPNIHLVQQGSIKEYLHNL